MVEKGIVPREPLCRGTATGAAAAGLWRSEEPCRRGSSGSAPAEGLLGHNPFLDHVAVQSVLQIDVKVQEPETLGNQSVVRDL